MNKRDLIDSIVIILIVYILTIWNGVLKAKNDLKQNILDLKSKGHESDIYKEKEEIAIIETLSPNQLVMELHSYKFILNK